MNKNYQAGRREEYATMKKLRANGYHVSRSAGSHGFFDICAIKDGRPVLLVQCKVTPHQSVAELLIKKFKEAPPLTTSKFYHQQLQVHIKGTSQYLVWTL